jgi:tetratricopeptide (TPR) repeat protein
MTAGFLTLFALSATGCKRLQSNDQLNKGVNDFKNAKYESATNHFQNAVNIDPDNPNAMVFLCTAYSSQIVPNLDTPENKKLASQATTCFRNVLQKDPNSVIALKQIASIDRNTGKFDEAKEFEKKVIALSPSDAEAYYTIGAIDWALAYKNATEELHAENLVDKGDGNVKISKPGCAKLVSENTPLVDEGNQYLQKSVEINTTYEEAMTYLSLMARRKADLECGNAPAIKTDLDAADQWAHKNMDARKINEQKKEEKLRGGVTQ